ncbi:MAG TPA: 1,6-anhydro-N-acetylmuramyl-L-alanine amidase AmpD [Gammaproteobacteria bacterium]|nr:1,6-anhydro-N-acetylmuramyl-L-alanine amidase AmpD [Gammaproteobacteria bacterium]
MALSEDQGSIRKLDVDTRTGLMGGARYAPSPNCDDRPSGEEISLVVIHGISLPPGEFGGDEVEAFFQNRLDASAHPYFREIEGLRVSAHLFIRRDGRIVQFVPFHRRAWHAGESCYAGRTGCNDFSIGIELEGTDDLAYSDQQYAVLNEVLRSLFTSYKRLDNHSVVGHCHVSPGRKTDPGPAFDWKRIGCAVKDESFGAHDV